MRYTYCADKERSHHYEKKKNPDIEHYIWQSQICVKKNNVCVYMKNTDMSTDIVSCVQRLCLKGDT